MQQPGAEHWFDLTEARLDIGAVYEWCLLPSCGAVVVFSGVVRDHAEGRRDVTHLEYHAYDEMVIPTFTEIADRARQDWSELGRIAILHRVGILALTESSVVVGVSAAHREQAFGAARFAIDAVKASAPIWKKEIWGDGVEWGTATELVPVGDVGRIETPSDRRVRDSEVGR